MSSITRGLGHTLAGGCCSSMYATVTWRRPPTSPLQCTERLMIRTTLSDHLFARTPSFCITDHVSLGNRLEWLTIWLGPRMSLGSLHDQAFSYEIQGVPLGRGTQSKQRDASFNCSKLVLTDHVYIGSLFPH